MPAKNRTLVGAWLTPAEKAELVQLKEQTGLSSLSELVRRLVVGRQPLPSAGRHLAVRELLKINADLARLGNLLKLALDDDAFVLPDGMDLAGLLDRIRDSQALLKSKIKEL